MYNSEQKRAFLDTITNDNSYKSYQRVFKNVEDMESKFGHDVCEMSIDEILTTMDLKTGTRISNTEQSMSLLKIYVDWCIQNGKASGSENNFEKIDSSEIDKSRVFKSKYVKSPEEFEHMISVVFGSGFGNNPDIENPKELCVRLCYEGLEDEEIVLLKKSDIDYENKVIKSPLYPDVIYKVSNRILALCRFCVDQTDVEYSGKSGARRERLCINDYVIRQRIGTLRGNPEDRPINKVNIIRRVKEFNDKFMETGDIYKNITAKTLRESHMLYRIYAAKDSLSFIDNEIRYDIECRNPEISDRQMYERLRQIGKTYNIWRNTFY